MTFLNVGCGDFRAPAPWVNVDRWPGVGPDVAADAARLPFADSSVSMLYAGHLIEHVALADLGWLLVQFWRVLEPGGQLCVVGPDHTRATSVADVDPELVAAILGDAGRWPGDQHQWVASEAAALDLIRPVFPDAAPVAIAELTGWPVVSYIWWQFAVLATKPATNAMGACPTKRERAPPP
jgi:Methyltransferase domain